MAIQKAKCKNCGEEFKFNPINKRGVYCTIPCRVEHTRKELDKLIRAGKAGAGALKKFIIRTRGNKCEACGCPPKWNGKPLTLQLDHKDGDSENNKPKNVQLLCPNCHTQTPTYGSKGVGNRYKKMRKRNIAIRKNKGYKT